MSKTTTIEYNNILNQYHLNCDCDDEYINKRKNYIHKCALCQYLFNTTPSKLLKTPICPNLANHDKIIDKLEIESYRNNLPDHIILKDGFDDMNKIIRHKCMWCKTIFKISPIEFKKTYKCPVCNK